MYYVQYTVGSAEHLPNIDVIVGPWGEGTSPDGRVLVALAYKPGQGAGSW